MEEVLSVLSPIESSWKDEHSEAVIKMLESIPAKRSYTSEDISKLLDRDFKTAITVVRLILDMSKDEFQVVCPNMGVKRYRSDRETFFSVLSELNFLEKLSGAVNRPLQWYDILVERLKAGRGSAIKGQTRGRLMEDFVEGIVKEIFSDTFDVRCRFTGATGASTEKTDFAIPSKEEPHILIEVKAYGATGSKQTDILGDIGRIVQEKRNDTDLLLVTDGVTWRARANDLRKLVMLQNQGKIARIYTTAMKEGLREDLLQLKQDHGL